MKNTQIVNRQLYLYFSFLKSFSWLRIINVSKLIISFYISRILKRNLHWGQPYSLSIEPTTTCNLSCLECPSGQKKFSRPTGKMNLKTLSEIIHQTGRHLWYVTLYFQGEPLMNPQFTEMVHQLKKRKIVVGTSTNAHFLNNENARKIIASKLDRLIISLDGTDEISYTKYRKGGNFNLVIKNIRNFMIEIQEQKSAHPFVELQFIVFKHNEHQINGIKQLGKQLGVDKVSIKTAQIYDYKQGNPLIPEVGKYSRYKQVNANEFTIKNKLPNYCQRMWNSAVITWDGKVVPCCFDKDASYQFGDINENSTVNIWHSMEYNLFRQRILNNRSSIDICRNCTEGMKN